MQERDVLRYIIKGVTDDEAMEVMLCSSRTYEELRDRLEFMGNAINTPAAGKNFNNNNSKSNKKVAGAQMKGQQKPKGDKCYNCGGTDHKIVDCPHKDKGPKCYKCNEFGHVSSACPQNKKKTA